MCIYIDLDIVQLNTQISKEPENELQSHIFKTKLKKMNNWKAYQRLPFGIKVPSH